MQHLFQHTDKNAISQLPLYKFSGRIIVIQGQFEAQRAVSALMKETLLGIDTETRPSFRKGRENKVALLQVATQDVCYLFRLNSLGFNESLVQLLQAESITKIGLSLKDDILRLRKMQEFTPCSFLDLQDYVKKFGIEDMSLQKIFANIFRKKISKSSRLSNWEADILTDAQKTYAATDAEACLKIYRRLKELEESHDYILISDKS